jgi:hypothetical protein
LGKDLHSHDDLTAVIGRGGLVGHVLNDVESRDRQARENRDNGDHHQEFNEGETSLECSFHSSAFYWFFIMYKHREGIPVLTSIRLILLQNGEKNLLNISKTVWIYVPEVALKCWLIPFMSELLCTPLFCSSPLFLFYSFVPAPRPVK